MAARMLRTKIEDIPSQIPDSLLENISQTLTKQIDKEIFKKKYAPIKIVLTLTGVGLFLGASVIMPNLPLALKPFLDHQRKQEYEAWKRFNIPYLKRTFSRLAKQKLVEITEENNLQVVKITEAGKRRILKFAINELAVEKSKIWDGRWTLISYDLPSKLKNQRKIFLEYLKAWGFYPLQESLFLHAYPCQKQVDFLRAYLGISEFVRMFTVSKIENDKLFRNFFGI